MLAIESAGSRGRDQRSCRLASVRMDRRQAIDDDALFVARISGTSRRVMYPIARYTDPACAINPEEIACLNVSKSG